MKTRTPVNPHKAAAIITIKKAGKMTKRGRRNIARWLRDQADYLEEFGNNYGPLFRSRYLHK